MVDKLSYFSTGVSDRNLIQIRQETAMKLLYLELQIWLFILKESVCYRTDMTSDNDFGSHPFHIWFLSCLVHVHFISDFNLKPSKLMEEKWRIFWFLAISWLILLLKLGAVNKSDKNQIWNGNYESVGLRGKPNLYFVWYQ